MESTASEGVLPSAPPLTAGLAASVDRGLDAVSSAVTACTTSEAETGARKSARRHKHVRFLAPNTSRMHSDNSTATTHQFEAEMNQTIHLVNYTCLQLRLAFVSGDHEWLQTGAQTCKHKRCHRRGVRAPSKRTLATHRSRLSFSGMPILAKNSSSLSRPVSLTHVPNRVAMNDE